MLYWCLAIRILKKEAPMVPVLASGIDTIVHNKSQIHISHILINKKHAGTMSITSDS